MRIHHHLLLTAVITLTAPMVLYGQIPTSFPTPVPAPTINPIDRQIRSVNEIQQAPTTRKAVATPITQTPVTATSIRATPASEYLYNLARQPIMTARAPVTIGPPDDRVLLLRQRAAYELEQIRISGFRLSLEALSTILSYNGDPTGDSTSAEDLAIEVKGHARTFLEITEEIEFLTGEKAEAERRLQARLENMRVEWKNYSVGISDSTTRVPMYQTPQPSASDNEPPKKPCYEQTEFPIKKVLQDVGFDEQGNPRREWRYDVVKTTRTVCE